MAAEAPRFIQGKPAPPPLHRRYGLAALGVLLMAALVLQSVLADRARLAADADWRPSLERLCGVLRCRLPPWHETSAFRVTARDVRPHPSVPGALLVTASFRNDAAFPQAWPQLELSLSDLDGQALGLRRFAPREYLGSAPASALIAPGQSASVTLEILDPGKRAVAFNFEFH